MEDLRILNYQPPSFISLNEIGSTDYITIPYSPSLNPNQFTFEAWLEVLGGVGTERVIFTARDFTGSPQKGYSLLISTSNRFLVHAGGDPWSTSLYTTDGIQLKRKYHVVMTHTGSIFSVYVNGVFQVNVEKAFVPNTSYDCRIGASIGTTITYGPCKIYSMRLWNAPLNQLAITGLYNGNIQTTNLVSEWLFNSNANDSVGSNHGIVTGDPYYDTGVKKKVIEPITVPTYNGNKNLTHPSILYRPEGWNGKKYWMALTPYPPDAEENPSIVCSDRMDRGWNPPVGLTNPVCPYSDAVADGYSYNSDPEIIILPNNVMRMYYRAVSSVPKKEAIFYKESADGVIWSGRQKLFESPSDDKIIAPSVVIESDGTFTMFCYDAGQASANCIQKRTSSDGLIWSDPINTTISAPTLWHIAVARTANKYYMLASKRYVTKDLYLYESLDGLTWTRNIDIYMPLKGLNWNSDGYYRCSFIVKNENPLDIRFIMSGITTVNGRNFSTYRSYDQRREIADLR